MAVGRLFNIIKCGSVTGVFSGDNKDVDDSKIRLFELSRNEVNNKKLDFKLERINNIPQRTSMIVMAFLIHGEEFTVENKLNYPSKLVTASKDGEVNIWNYDAASLEYV